MSPTERVRANGTGDAPVLICHGLVKRYGERTAVDGVGFSIGPGECYGLLGPNGAGKTTTISMVCGLLARDAGTVVVDGRPVDHDSVEAKVAIGYVPQEIALYPELSAADNLRFFGRLYGLHHDELDECVAGAMEAVGLAGRAGDKVGTFSGGMKRRANIAAGLLHRPRLLVLDEPTVGVDPQSRHAILDTVLQLRDGGMAVLYTTHYMEEAEQLCHRVGIIDGGRLIAEGTRRQLVTGIGGRDRMHLGTEDGHDARALLADACRAVAGVHAAVVTADGVELSAPDARRLLPAVVEAAAAVGARLSSVEVAEPDLEAVFLHLTGKELRD